MLAKLSASTMLNLGSLATFAAFPLLYSASFGGGSFALAFGGLLMICGMLAPFVALRFRDGQ